MMGKYIFEARSTPSFRERQGSKPLIRTFTLLGTSVDAALASRRYGWPLREYVTMLLHVLLILLKIIIYHSTPAEPLLSYLCFQ